MAGGAYIKISGGNIELACPGTISIKGAEHNFSGPASIGMDIQGKPSADYHSMSFTVKDVQGNIQKNMPYLIKDGKGNVFSGITDNKGRTQRIHTSSSDDLLVHLDHDALGNQLED